MAHFCASRSRTNKTQINQNFGALAPVLPSPTESEHCLLLATRGPAHSSQVGVAWSVAASPLGHVWKKQRYEREKAMTGLQQQYGMGQTLEPQFLAGGLLGGPLGGLIGKGVGGLFGHSNLGQ